MSVIAVIPARGGSKRIPRKNAREFCGKPMIVWSIEAAQRSGLFDRVIVSTDDAEIKAISLRAGAEVPFDRPDSLSDDHTGTVAVVAHAVRHLMEQGERVQSVCCLYATAPFIRVEDLSAGYKTLVEGKWEFVFSAAEFAAPIWRSFEISASGEVRMFFPEHESRRSQDLPKAWHDAAQFYWGRAEAWTTRTAIFGPHSTAICLPRWRVHDIDTPEDWEAAERMAAIALHEGERPLTERGDPA